MAAGRALAQEGYTLVLSMRSLANPYHATFADGGRQFAESVGLPFEVLVTEGNSEKGIADVRALLARTGGKMVLNIDLLVHDILRQRPKLAKRYNGEREESKLEWKFF